MQRMASAVSLVDQAFENNVFLLDNQKDFAEPPPIVFLPLETDTVTRNNCLPSAHLLTDTVCVCV